MPSCVLMVEDEPLIAENIIYALKTEGFEALHRGTLQEAEAVLASQPVDLVVLDINLPDGNGFDFFHVIQERFGTPVIFLTARSSEVDRVVGLEMGGDDYVVKPVSPRELAARVKAVLRRGRRSENTLHPPQSPEPLSPTPSKTAFRVDKDTKQIFFKDSPLQLSACEFRLLEVLVRRPGKIFSREELLERAWDDPGASTDRTVDAHIKNIRSKLHAIACDEEPIRTHRGFGYSLVLD